MGLDATDTGILRCLQEDARAPLRTIAKEVGASTPAVSARLQNLEPLGIVRGFRVVLNPEGLDETSLALVVQTKHPSTDRVAEGTARFPWARRVLVGRPGWILVEATVVRREEVDGIVRAVSSIPEVVDVQPYAGLRTVKDAPAAVLHDHLTANLACFECKGPILGEPVKVRRDGRYHYFCCHTCERLYLERYDRIRKAGRMRA